MTKKMSISVIRFSFPVVLLFVKLSLVAQPSQYTIESFQDVYTELSSYQSVAILTEGSIFWEYEFDLNFDFPFFDSVYNKLIYREEAWGSLTEDQDEALLLMDFLNGYVFDNVIDTSNITSDVRFAHVDASGMQAFILQYTNVRFWNDPYAESHDTYFNFQLWFYENGVMEVQFGDIQLDNNPIYLPGFGFWCYDDEGIDSIGRCGPHMGIANPLDESIAIGLEGAYNDFEIIEDNYATLTVIPPQGWVIRFKPITVATSDPTMYEQLVLSPNPTNDVINLAIKKGKAIVFDFAGRIVYEQQIEEGLLNVSFLPPGIYYMQLISSEKISIGKFIRL